MKTILEKFVNQADKLSQSLNALIKDSNKTFVPCPTCKRDVTLFEYSRTTNEDLPVVICFSGWCPYCGGKLYLFTIKENEK